MECKEKGEILLHFIPLHPLHDMRKIRGTYLEITSRCFYQNSNPKDYVQITLTDEEDIPDGIQKLRTIYPNLMRLEYDNSRTRKNHIVEAAEDIEQKSELELFEEFYEFQNNHPMDKEQKEFIKRIIENTKKEGIN